jgi:nicotinate-nucleotide adenylyltransferase
VFRAGLTRRKPVARGSSALRLGLNLAPGMRVGLYGGSFNPAHGGHAHVAQVARARLGLDRVVWLVSPQNPLKPDYGAADLARRLAQTARVARGPGMIVSDAEQRLGTRYTLDTLRALKARRGGVHLVWIMGADSLATFHAWRGWDRIMREVAIAVVARPGVSMRALTSPAARRFAFARLDSRAARRLATTTPPAWVWLDAPLNAESSTALRECS